MISRSALEKWYATLEIAQLYAKPNTAPQRNRSQLACAVRRCTDAGGRGRRWAKPGQVTVPKNTCLRAVSVGTS